MLRDAAPLPGYPEPYATLAAVLQDGTREWRAELDPDLPADAVVWRPYPGGPSIGAVMLHLINVEIGWLEEAVFRKRTDPEEARLLMSKEIDVDAGRWPDPHPQPMQWYFDLHDRIRARTLESIRAWPPPETPMGEEYPDTPRWILGHVIQHEAYHGGQMVLLNALWRRTQVPQ